MNFDITSYCCPLSVVDNYEYYREGCCLLPQIGM